MPRNDWRDGNPQNPYADTPREHPSDYLRRPGYRTDDPPPRRLTDDERDYARRMNDGDYPSTPQSRSWMDRAGEFFARPAAPARRRGPSDRVLWTVIVERLDLERRLDLSDLEIIVENAEVTLNGTVRHKDDKRRIEDVADIDGVRHVQNNLRVRDHAPWTFL